MKKTLEEQFRGYKGILRKYGVTSEVLSKLDSGEYSIELYDEKLINGKSVRVTEEEVTAEYYCNYVSSIPGFNDKVIKDDVLDLGKIPVKLTCVSPDGTIEYVRVFLFKKEV